jgi:anti-sigma factor RsiW
MTCIHPPELTDDQISDLLDGRADSETQAHLKQCAHCRGHFEQARQLEQRLHGRLRRWGCPSDDTIRDYAFNLLDANTRKQLTEHIKTCPRCREELRQINDFVGSEAVSEALPVKSPTARRRTWPNVWRPQPLQGNPAFAMRGRDSSETVMLEINGVTLFIEAQTEDDGLWLAGRLVAADMEQWDGALIEVWQDSSLQSTTSVKDSGFRCRLRGVEPVDIRISSKTGPSLLIERLTFIDEPPE